MTSCPRCGAATAQDASFCASCGMRLVSEDDPAPQARKTVTVMFADVSSFTRLAEQIDPESLQQLMSRYFATMREIVARHGGTVEKLIGDAVMAVFGVPVIHEDDALRAARTALETQTSLDRLNAELAQRWDVRVQVHTGLNTGEVVVGRNPDGDREIYGDAVNVAQRLQAAAQPGEILVGPVTADLLRGVARMAPLPALAVKGRAAPVTAWRLLGMGDDERRSHGLVSEIVGRRTERASLRAAFERVVASRRPELVTVVGPAGIGKSRLARAVGDEVGEVAAVATGRCLPYGEGITYWPVNEIVRHLAGQDETTLATAAGGGAEGRTIAERVARVTGMRPGSVTVEEAHWAVRRLLEVRAVERPLVVVVDDIHWAEPSLLDLLEHVAEHARDAPLLVVCLARPDLADRRPAWIDGGPGTVIWLDPLPDDDAAALLSRLTAAVGYEASDAEELLATAEGNPFFLEQIVAMRTEPDAVPGRLPASIQTLLAARVDTLPAPERAVIDRAAVEGRNFHRNAMAELLDAADRPGLDVSLDALTRRYLIRAADGEGDVPGEPGYEFVHILVRDVVYELMPKARRATLHERYASWLEVSGGVRYGEVVGYHLEQAHRLHAELRPMAADERRPLGAAAARWLGGAGHAALDRGDMAGGVNLLERTAALIPADDPERTPVLSELGLALVQLGRLRDAEDVLIDATRAAAARGDEVAEAHARAAHLLALVPVDPETATEQLDALAPDLRRVLGTACDDVGLSRLYRAEALQHWLLGRTAKAEAAWMRGMRHSRQAGDEQGAADAFVWLASAALLGPTPVPRAISWCNTILDNLRSDRRSLALGMRPLAALHGMAGHNDIAASLFAESRAIHEALGVGMHAAVAHDEALLALAAGDPAHAEALLRPGVERLEEIGERALFATTAGLLATAILDQGREDEAWELAVAAEAAAATDDLSAQLIWRCVRARILVRQGMRSEADELSREAVDISAATDWLIDRADTLMVRGEVLSASGHPEQASRAIHKAFDLYTRKGHVIAAQRARSAVDHPRVRRNGATA